METKFIGGIKVSKQKKLFEETYESGGGSYTKSIEVKQGLRLRGANSIAANVLTMVDAFCEKIEVVGSIRRQKSTINDIDFLVFTTDSDWKKVKESMVNLLGAKVDCTGNSILRTIIYSELVAGYVQVDFYRATENIYGVTKLIRTGSAEHNVYLAKLAIKQGKRLLYSKGVIDHGVVIAGKEESDVFKVLGLEYIEPQEREIIEGKPAWVK